MPFSSADRKTSLPNLFLVTACKKKKKKRGGNVKNIEQIIAGAVWWAEAVVCMQGGKAGEEK